MGRAAQQLADLTSVKRQIMDKRFFLCVDKKKVFLYFILVDSGAISTKIGLIYVYIWFVCVCECVFSHSEGRAQEVASSLRVFDFNIRTSEKKANYLYANYKKCCSSHSNSTQQQPK